MDRPKHLPPTLKERKRYIAFQIIAESKIETADVFNTLWHALLNFLGEFGVAESGIWISKLNYNETKQLGIIKCNHISVEHVRASLSLIQRIGDSRAIVKVLGVSGTIKAAKKKFFDEVDLKSFA